MLPLALKLGSILASERPKECMNMLKSNANFYVHSIFRERKFIATIILSKKLGPEMPRTTINGSLRVVLA